MNFRSDVTSVSRRLQQLQQQLPPQLDLSTILPGQYSRTIHDVSTIDCKWNSLPMGSLQDGRGGLWTTQKFGWMSHDATGP